MQKIEELVVCCVDPYSDVKKKWMVPTTGGYYKFMQAGASNTLFQTLSSRLLVEHSLELLEPVLRYSFFSLVFGKYA